MSDLELVVLGSGGPFANPTRASSAFVVLDEGRPLALIDAGGGAFERLGQAEIPAKDIDVVLLTHLHIDHSGGLAPIVFSAWMEGREEALTLIGPAPLDDQPGVSRFAEALFGEEGAWSYLHSFEGFGIDAIEMPSESEDAKAEEVPFDDLSIRSVAVPHGMMPTLAYRLDLAGGKSIVFSGDVQEDHALLSELAAGCDTLVCDFALPERDTEHGHLHAKPSEVGAMAQRAGCSQLVLTHVMPELEDEIDPALELVRESYDGDITVASDLLRIAI